MVLRSPVILACLQLFWCRSERPDSLHNVTKLVIVLNCRRHVSVGFNELMFRHMRIACVFKARAKFVDCLLFGHPAINNHRVADGGESLHHFSTFHIAELLRIERIERLFHYTHSVNGHCASECIEKFLIAYHSVT